MGERQDYVALDWVAGEIQETLTQASQALQAYIANRDDTTKLRFCLTHIHQVHGTLKMVEFFGAALLAEEMESLVLSLSRGAIHDSHVDDALIVLQNAIAQLPIYLERVKESRHGLPAALLPVLNDLRAVRGESLLSETVLFAPNMNASLATGKSGKLLVEGNELKEVVHKLRQMYQIALLGLIREQDVRKNINYLAKVCSRLVKLTSGRALYPLWKVCIALLEGLLNQSIECSVAVKILLRHLDRQIKHILDLGEVALDQAPPEHLLKNLLYYIACCAANSRYIREVKNEYKLETSLLGDNELDDQGVAQPDSLAMQSVVQALAHELNGIKSALVAADTQVKELANVLPLFRRVSDTMAILGLGATLKPIQESHSQLAKLLATQDVINASEINGIIQNISRIESELRPVEIEEPVSDRSLFNDSEEAQEQLDGAFDSVLRECRAGLEQTKEAIIEFVATQWNHNCLNDVPALLSQIHGSLAMVPLEQAAQIIHSCENYVNRVLLAQRSVPEWQMLDTLADAITSIDYYLERLTDDPNAANEGILEVAAESVAELGYPIVGAMSENIASTDASIADGSVGEQEPAIQDNTIDSGKNAPVSAQVIPFQPKSNDSANSGQASSVDDDSEDEDFDPEIVEIFIEEAGEVLESIDQYLPQWIDNNSDEEARANVRRAFHTLKGSGRMVDAVDIAELAWSIESMLNRVIDNSFVMDDTRFDIVNRAKSYIPDMVSAFEHRQPIDLASIEVLIGQADTLTKEQHLPADLVSHGERLEQEAPNVEVDEPIAQDTSNNANQYEVEEYTLTEVQDLDEMPASAEQILVEEGTPAAAEDVVGETIDSYEVEQAPAQEEVDSTKAEDREDSFTKDDDVLPEKEQELAENNVSPEQEQNIVQEDSSPYTEHVISEDENSVVSMPVRDDISGYVYAEDDVSPAAEQILAEEVSSQAQQDVLEMQVWSEEAADSDNTSEAYEFDAELLDIFASETTTHLKILNDFIDHCKELAGPADLTDDLQRAMHTLKGSANMAGVAPVAILITPVEHVVKELRASQLKVDTDLVVLLEQAAEFIQLGLDQLNTTPMQSLPDVESFIDRMMTYYKERVAQDTDDVLQGNNSVAPQAQNQLLTDSLDQINEINARLVLWRSGTVDTSDFDSIERALNRLIERAENANVMAMAEFGQAMRALFHRAASVKSSQVSEGFFDLAAHGSDALVDMLDQIAGHQNPEYDQQLLKHIQDYEFTPQHIPKSPIDDSVIENDSIIEITAEGGIEDNDIPVVDDVIDVVDTEADTPLSDAELPDDSFIELLTQDSDLLSGADVVEVDFQHVPAVVADSVVPVDEQIPTLNDISDTTDLSENTDQDETSELLSSKSGNDDDSGESVDIVTEIMTDLVGTQGGADKPNVPVLDTPASPVVTPFNAASMYDDNDDDIDAEIQEIFLEEADDLLESIDESIHKWGDDREGREYLDDLQRILHTLKGGARLAKLTELGNLSHNFETFLINAESNGTVVNDAFLSEVQQFQDQLITQVTVIKAGGTAAPATKIEQKPDVTLDNAVQSKTVAKTADALFPVSKPTGKPRVDVVPFVAKKANAPTAIAKPAAPNMAESAAKKGPQEVVKVSAQLLEELVNLAGETSISRGQAEEQISELVFSLEEMQITVDRLQEQVRRLDMETEQQILYRQEQVESEGLEGFDPLEMDRYSALQQLSRSLLESSSDLIDIKSTLYDKSRDMETLLIQQSRINTELQEGLMRSRMVPFSRMVPRLRRIVRQVSGELDKKVDFKLHNIEGELDRTVLERMVAPLEHMLRNAIDHGLESPEERERLGKPKKGTVALDLNREGGEIVITMSDDGSGINLHAVKRKAIERGLMEPNASLSDHEISQFILQSGFTTAVAVTQLSGRGVGMDVVHSEIKQLGGSIDIESVQGEGTQFIVRLPFTVSVNRALMVSVDGDIYAVPLNTIEGIVRVSPFELEAYYQPDAPMFEYAGQPYLLRYMGALLRRGDKPMLDGQTMPLPVVLVRGVDHSVAIQVDHLLGSREIVVKPLGPQFSLVQGLSGATVLGDGSVVVILDLLAMIRADALYSHKDYIPAQETVHIDERALLVMVVDDSVTVRKVTSRFLERQGMEVLLAKDGVDAMTQLQELDRIPDVMLLDIEMPRMDGFEVASRVRHNSRLKALPIIMITSRTGEKHRERALALGVNYYMGKPYQEVELLDTINSLSGITAE